MKGNTKNLREYRVVCKLVCWGVKPGDGERTPCFLKHDIWATTVVGNNERGGERERGRGTKAVQTESEK